MLLHVNWPGHEEFSGASGDAWTPCTSTSKSLLEASPPSDDMWKKFLTPPSSPRSIAETSENEDAMESFNSREQLQYVCDNLDSSFELTSSCCSNPVNLRSKLISDCMWSGIHAEASKRVNTEDMLNVCISKLSDSAEDIYPSPCPSPPPSDTDIPDYPSSSECVDPATVFPLPIANNDSLSSQTDDTDEEIDVVTVDAKPRKFTGIKRKTPSWCSSRSVVIAKIETSTSILRRTKSSPCKLRNDKYTSHDRFSSKRPLVIDESPIERRSVHNVLERKRRIDLKKSFERLRECVPDLEHEEKAPPKVVVLKKASMHILALKLEGEHLEEQKELLQLEHSQLSRRLRELCSL